MKSVQTILFIRHYSSTSTIKKDIDNNKNGNTFSKFVVLDP